MGREINYRNPYGSIPSPAAKEIPKTLWFSQPGLSVPWSGVGTLTAGVDRAGWQSPVFDLRPDLRASQAMARSGVPIWDTSARLYVQIFNLAGAVGNTQFLRMNYFELANTTFGQITEAGPPRAVAPIGGGFPAQTARNPVVRVTATVDLTSELMLGTNQPDSVVVVFAPLGEGYPIRYWQINIGWINIGVAGPALNFQAAMY